MKQFEKEEKKIWFYAEFYWDFTDETVIHNLVFQIDSLDHLICNLMQINVQNDCWLIERSMKELLVTES